MATYTKKLKTLAVHLMLDSEVVNIADTASDDMATRALNEFKKYETMHYVTEDGGQKVTNAIPYHAVQYIEVTEADGSVERKDPYGCEDGGGDTVTITFDTTCGNNPPNSGTPEPIVAKKGDIITMPDIHTTYNGAGWAIECNGGCGASYDEGNTVSVGEDIPFEDATLYYSYPCV